MSIVRSPEPREALGRRGEPVSKRQTITSTLASQHQLGGTPAPASAFHWPRNARANPAREAAGPHRSYRPAPPGAFGLTKVRQKSRAERVKVHSSVSGTQRGGSPIQLSMTYWSGFP